MRLSISHMIRREGKLKSPRTKIRLLKLIVPDVRRLMIMIEANYFREKLNMLESDNTLLDDTSSNSIETRKKDKEKSCLKVSIDLCLKKLILGIIRWILVL